MKTICVFAGSSSGHASDYISAAQQLGEEMAERGLDLVYGGSRGGLMGEVADAVLERGGKAYGVIPSGLFRGEIVHAGLTQLHEVKDMHERKALMSELSDAFIALPGGMGTFEELFEVLSWSQLGIHRKPIGLVNTCSFYSPVKALIDHASEAGFIRADQDGLYILEDRIPLLLDGLLQFERPAFEEKWSNKT